jgi:hypothetical protein
MGLGEAGMGLVTLPFASLYVHAGAVRLVSRRGVAAVPFPRGAIAMALGRP